MGSNWLAGGLVAGFRNPDLLGRTRDAGYQVEGSHSERAHAEDNHSPDGRGVHPVSLVMLRPPRDVPTRLLGSRGVENDRCDTGQWDGDDLRTVTIEGAYRPAGEIQRR